MSNFILTRPWKANDLCIKLCYLLAGCLLLLNIHFSAITINEDGIANGALGISSAEAILSTYVPAIFVSAYCFLTVGFLSHPLGIPSVLSQIKTVQAKVKTPLALLAAYLISIGVIAILCYWLYACYRFDIYTTQMYLGYQNFPLFSFQQLPTWSFIAGPEVIMVVGNGLSVLNGGGGTSPQTVRVQGTPQPQGNPHAQVRQPQPQQTVRQPQPSKQGNPWNNL